MQRARLVILLIIALVANYEVLAQQDYYDNAPPRKSEVIEEYNIDMARCYMDSTDIMPLEGIWEFPDDQITLSIERFQDPRFSARFKYRIILLTAEDRSIPHGSIMGYIAETAVPNKFYIWIYSLSKEGVLSSPQKCVATLAKDNSFLTFVKPEIKFKLRFNFARFLPTLFKGLSIYTEENKEKIPLGFRRLYPTFDEDGSRILEIRYL